MISGYIAKNCIARQPLGEYAANTMKLQKNITDPIEVIKIELVKPEFTDLSQNKEILAMNYSQVLREIPSLRGLPELSQDYSNQLTVLMNQYRDKMGLTRLLEDYSDENLNIEEEKSGKICETKIMPSNPYVGMNFGANNYVNNLIGMHVQDKFYSAKNDNLKILVSLFMQKTGKSEEDAKFFLESSEYDVEKAIKFASEQS